MDFKNTLREAGTKALEQTLKQWIGKLLLAALPALGVYSYQSFMRYKDRVILAPVRPELVKLGLRIDSLAISVDSGQLESKRYARQNTRFQVVLVKKFGLEGEIKRMRSESRVKKKERAELEDALEGLAE